MLLDEKIILLQIIHDQIRRHPGFQIEDLYTLLYQSTCGAKHYIENRHHCERMLKEEWKDLGKLLKGEPLLEMIDPKGEILRVNLRVYKKIGGNRSRIYHLLIDSMSEFKESKEQLVQYWEIVLDMAVRNEFQFSLPALNKFWSHVKKNNFPVCHHSESYVDANRPAYRIVLKSLWVSI